MYYTGTSAATVEFRSGSAPFAQSQAFSCTALAGTYSTCTPSGGNALGGSLIDLRITSFNSNTTYLYTTFSCN